MCEESVDDWDNGGFFEFFLCMAYMGLVLVELVLL